MRVKSSDTIVIYYCDNINYWFWRWNIFWNNDFCLTCTNHLNIINSALFKVFITLIRKYHYGPKTTVHVWLTSPWTKHILPQQLLRFGYQKQLLVHISDVGPNVGLDDWTDVVFCVHGFWLVGDQTARRPVPWLSDRVRSK